MVNAEALLKDGVKSSQGKRGASTSAPITGLNLTERKIP
jgi:hypothetical protein